MDFFNQIEDRDGVRFSWNIWPSSRLDASRLVVPLGSMYTPLKKGNDCPTVYYKPVKCGNKNCNAYLNPYCHVDFDTKTWSCPFCIRVNQFPPQYAGMTPQNLPAELNPQVTSIEYIDPKQGPMTPPIYLFVVDITYGDSLQQLKETLLKTLSLLPQQSLIGLITYGCSVQVYDLLTTDYSKCFTFKGEKDLPSRFIEMALGLDHSLINKSQNPFLVPLSICEENLKTLINEISIDPKTVQANKRPLRCTGMALHVGISLLAKLYESAGARILTFMGGPCTFGPGIIVSEAGSEMIRSHHDLNKEKAKHYASSSKYYHELAKKAATFGYAVDLFSCALDQTGLLEMRSLVKSTGGLMVLSDGFEYEVFYESLYKLFEKDEQGQLQFGLSGKINVVTSAEIRVMGAIGHLSSRNKNPKIASDKELGIGKTTSWSMCSVDKYTSYAFFFEIINQHGNPIPNKRYGMVQYRTRYYHPNGYKVLKVTTVAHSWSDPSLGHKAVLPGFDQETAAALIARLAVFKNEKEDANAIRWIDRTLIQLYSRFCDYQKNIPESLQIPQEMNIFHQFMFYLRRGPLIQTFNNSPDESTFFRYCLMRENVGNVMIMIQPTLDSYTLDNDPQPVLLTPTSVQPTNVLLLDTFFHIVVHVGKTVAEWRKEGYHENPEYENVRELLEFPVEDAQMLLSSRLPLPMYIECDQDTSQSRFLKATLDPAITHKDSLVDKEKGQVVFSEDVNLKYFVNFLYKRVVEYEQ